MKQAILRIHRLPLPFIAGFFVIYYLVGVIGLSIEATRELFIVLMPFSIIMSTAFLILFHKPWKRKHIIVFTAIALAGFLVEAVGVHTGIIFGQYIYQDALGLMVAGTPLLIGVNWIMLIYCVYVIFRNHLKWNPLISVIAGSALMVVYDFIMEPVAMSSRMWTWQNQQVPLQNYLAWFVISLVFLSVLYIAKLRFENKLAVWMFGIQLSFFLILNILL